LILYSYLPRLFIDKLLQKIPDLENIFSYIFCGEDMLENDQFIIKDLGQLLFSRNADDIIIIETQPEHVDEEYFSSIIVQPYDGSLNYS
jgi:hypothetical protein